MGLPLLLCGGAFGAALLIGAGHLRLLHITGFTTGNVAINILINFAVMMIVLMGEEIGWRAFMLPRVQMLTSKRRAALVTGLVQGLFHLPLILIATTYDAEGPRWLAAPIAVLTITAAGVFYAWLWDRSGSPWAVTVGHTAANLTFASGFSAVASTTSTSLALVAGETGVATLAVVVTLAVVLLKAGDGLAGAEGRRAGAAREARGLRLDLEVSRRQRWRDPVSQHVEVPRDRFRAHGQTARPGRGGMARPNRPDLGGLRACGHRPVPGGQQAEMWRGDSHFRRP